MATFITGGNEVFQAALYSGPDWKALEYLQNQYQNVNQYATAASQQFFNAAKHTYDILSGSTALRTARAAAAKIKRPTVLEGKHDGEVVIAPRAKIVPPTP